MKALTLCLLLVVLASSGKPSIFGRPSSSNNLAVDDFDQPLEGNLDQSQ